MPAASDRGVGGSAATSGGYKLAAVLAVALSGVSLGISPPVHARGEQQLEELVVSAQKREENLLDVPISISVLTAEEIHEMVTFRFADTEDLTPGVEFNSGLQSAAIRLRGVGPGAFALNAPQSVAVFVDQFAQAQVGTVFGAMFDVQRVELLRGPQGMLYGQNAPGGVYSITTRRPNSEEFGGYVQGSYSQHNEDADRASHDIRGALNIPLLERQLAWRLAGVYRKDDGFVTMEHPDARHHAAGGGDTQSLRSRLLWNISGNKKLLWTVNYGDFQRHPVIGNLDGQVPGSGGVNPQPAVSASFRDRAYWGDFRSDVRADLRDTSLHYVWETAGPKIDFLGSYQSFDNTSMQNRAPFFGGESLFMLDYDFEVTTLEVRASEAGDSLDYIAGVYYYDRPVNTDAELMFGQAPIAGNGGSSSTNYSAFGGVNMHWYEPWALALGVRYDASEADIDFNTRYADAVEGALKDSSSFDHFTWSVKLRWHINDRTMAYTATDTGFKQGGYNVLVLPAATVTTDFPLAAEVASDAVQYDEETSQAFELGVKGTAFDNSLRYSLALYHQAFDDHQLTHSAPDVALAPFGDLFTNVISNAERVTTRGVEMTVAYVLGKRWRLSHRAAYADPDVEKWTRRYCNGGEADDITQVYCPRVNEPLNNASKWKANTQLRYQRPVGAWGFYSRLNWTWVSEVSATGVTDEFREDKNIFGLTLGLRSKASGIDLRLWGKNLTDEDRNQNPGLQQNGDPDEPPAFRGNYSRGRELGVSIGYRF